ncbi:MAG: inositol monophosphatase family protein [Ancalomicrobiaceae bacterium]|nr:inositol monophosphatase family protein [Ancalomicrobiaceae bacterium]
MQSFFSTRELRLRLSVAAAVAREAGALQRRRFYDRTGAGRAYDFKGHQDYLTATDTEVERLVRERFSAIFPDDGILGEEEGGDRKEVNWIVDPVDGTANFARGIPRFCISIGLAAANRGEIGVIYQPITDELFAAATGLGATLDGEPIHVSTIDNPDRASIELGWSNRMPFDSHREIADAITKLGMRINHCGSGALGMADVACGRSDGFVEKHIWPWDVIAGYVLVREAGGAQNDYEDGGRGLIEGNPILAATPGIAGLLEQATGWKTA